MSDTRFTIVRGPHKILVRIDEEQIRDVDHYVRTMLDMEDTLKKAIHRIIEKRLQKRQQTVSRKTSGHH